MSEFCLIAQYFAAATAAHCDTVVGIGDDAAISQPPVGCQLVSCLDTLVAGRHFPLSTSAFAIGWKSVAVNLSDLAAMGATPYAILLGISLPSADEVWLGEFSRGLGAVCQRFGVQLIGGDTTKSDTLTISVTALGWVPNGQAICRRGAQVGDVVCVSGNIGSASFALQQVLRNASSDLQEALDLPVPHVALGQALRGFASSMIDVSDGLAQDLGHILAASAVGARLNLAAIPSHLRLQHLPNAEKWQHQLNGGDDYQLCFTIARDKLAEFEQMHSELSQHIYPIGEIIAGSAMQLFDGQTRVHLTTQGYQHF